MVIDERKIVEALADEIERASAQGRHLAPPRSRPHLALGVPLAAED